MKLYISTFPNQKTAEEIGETLVEEGLAGCVNLLPSTSIYIWDGETKHEEEVTALFKVSEDMSERFEEGLEALHPYDVPEMLDIGVGVNEGYEDWISEIL